MKMEDLLWAINCCDTGGDGFNKDLYKPLRDVDKKEFILLYELGLYFQQFFRYMPVFKWACQNVCAGVCLISALNSERGRVLLFHSKHKVLVPWLYEGSSSNL